MDTVPIPIQRANAVPPLTKEDEVQLALDLKAGKEEAISRFVDSHIKLVYGIAYDERFKGRSDIDELVSAGLIALATAAKSFKPEKSRFNTYCKPIVRSAMEARIAKNNGRVFSVSKPLHKRINEVLGVRDQLRLANNYIPSAQEITDYINSNKQDHPQNIHLRSVEAIIAYTRVVNLNAPFSPDDPDRSLISCYPDPSGQVLKDQEIEEEQRHKLQLALQNLSPRALEVMTLRYGSNKEEPLKQREIAARLGVSQAAVNDMEKKSLKKLRAHLH